MFSDSKVLARFMPNDNKKGLSRKTLDLAMRKAWSSNDKPIILNDYLFYFRFPLLLIYS